jgi:hypothetical protein
MSHPHTHPDCPICRAEETYQRDMARIYTQNCDMCRQAGRDRKMTHYDDRYGNMCDEHFAKFKHRLSNR